MDQKVNGDVWQGRVDDAQDFDSFRYHQIVQSSALAKPCDIGLIGFMCDEGVRRNFGRVGTKHAPTALRQQLASIPWRGGKWTIADMGDIICADTEMEQAQQELGEKVAGILTSGVAIILGGGHEAVYGQYLGVRQAVGPYASIGLLNIDAHFDLRPYDKEPSSGTMFKQILDKDENVHYFVCGIQRYGNTTALFKEAARLNVTYFLDEELSSAKFRQSLQHFLNAHDVLLVSICMDVINAAEAPGVSAPSPFGLQARDVRHLVHQIMTYKKATSFSICEVNPLLDSNGQTAKLAAAFINEAIMSSLQKT
ncbi:MAG: formimidoylglutamase [Solibacillus sp.]